MSQLAGKSAEGRNAALVMLDILVSTKNNTAAEVAVEIVPEAPKNQWTRGAVRSACRQTLPNEPK